MDPAAQPDQDQWDRFRERLDAVHDFPCYYTFKVIFPSELFYHVKSMMPDIDFSSRGSRKGNYLSLTYHIPASTSDEIISLYRRMSRIKGVITL